MKNLNTYCLKCEVLHGKRRVASVHVKEDEIDIPLCKDCYIEWQIEQEFLLNQEEDIYGDSNSED